MPSAMKQYTMSFGAGSDRGLVVGLTQFCKENRSVKKELFQLLA